MRRIAMQVGLMLVLLTFALPARAGIDLITFAHPFHAQNLAGVVMDSTGAPVPGVVLKTAFRRLERLGDQTTQNRPFSRKR
jgi:hypothetical protein